MKRIPSGIDINDPRQAKVRFRRGDISSVKMGMPVKVITRLCHPQQPVNGF
jgi:hypothetical protein